MPIDTSIYGNIQPYKAPDQLNQLARVMQVQGLQRDNQLGQLKMDEYQRGVEDQNALRSALSAPGADVGNALLKLGKVKEYSDYQKGQTDIAKNKAATSKDMAETATKKLGLYRDQMFNVGDSATAVQLIQAMHQDPDLKGSGIDAVPLEKLVAQIPQDPAQFEAFKQKFAMGAEKFMADLRAREGHAITLRGQDVTADTTRRGQDMTAETSRRGQDITVRGQNLADARSRESNAQGKTQIVETPQGFVIVDKNTGESRPAVGADGQPLKGKANDRVMTDAQAKANLFGSRMAESHRILNDLEGKYSPGAVDAKMAAGNVPVVGGLAGYAGNLMLSTEGQQAEQAQRDYINAVLRRESGAVISDPEFANARKQYLPQPGDDKKTLDQKRRNRELAIKGMEAEVPGGFRTGPSLTQPGNSSGPQPGTVQDGFRFKGGNPADPKSWEKV